MDNLTRKQNGMAYIADYHCNFLMAENRRKLHEFNNAECWTDKGMKQQCERLRSILGGMGNNITILPPFHCDYGSNIKVGDNFFANYNLTVLDVAEVTFGNNVFIGPNVSVYTAGHPVHYLARNSMYEYGIPVSIGDNVWLGGNVVICPGVKIGSGSVIGAGSVVVRDVPENVIAAGNPCKVIRKITDEDIKYYFRDREFDDEAMADIMKFADGNN
ncbi:MAG: sugar O-acetyltransferase [Oscillospiraceae bacterium]|nr:sugar O-acetyltransferase [Oscillospiraceae bacterium]